MSDYEKISIYVPHSTKHKLEEDARLFEVFKHRNLEINLNRFLGNLLLGYYDQFDIDTRRSIGLISDVLKKHVRKVIPNEIEGTALEIVRTLSTTLNTHGEKSERLSLKPTSATIAVINLIRNTNTSDSISNSFVRIFDSYFQKPTYRREQIIYKDKYDSLQSSIFQNRTITFSTTKNPDIRHIVFPYMITTGTDELFNYLLCAERDNDSGELKAKSYRLCRITNVHINRETIELSNIVKQRLDKMSIYGPAYEINDNDECCVFLTKEGHKSYSMVYSQRPPYKNIIPVKDGYLYFFDCSKEHVERYFRRFNPIDVIIKSPDSLRNSFCTYFENGLKQYVNNQ